MPSEALGKFSDNDSLSLLTLIKQRPFSQNSIKNILTEFFVNIRQVFGKFSSDYIQLNSGIKLQVHAFFKSEKIPW